MSEEKTENTTESLGGYLLRQRTEQNITIDDLAADTRVPPKTIRAIEADDYSALPAEAFARGFYALIARRLGLDEKEILARFSKEQGLPSASSSFSPPTTQGKHVNTLAARPSIASGAKVGLSLIVLIIIIGLASYYFSWNPATFISEQLRSLQSFQATEQSVLPVDDQTEAVTVEQAIPPRANYSLTMEFHEDTYVTASVDDSFPENEIYTSGSTHSWYARDSITVILPAAANVTMKVNGTFKSLPAPEGDFITITLP